MPTLNDLNLSSAHLSNLSVQVSNELEGLIAEQVFPTLQVKADRGNYYTFDNNMLRIDNSERGEGARANRVDWGLSSTAYGPLVEHSLEHWIDDQIMSQAVSGLEPVANAVKFLTQKLHIVKENKLGAYLGSTGNVTNNTTLSGTDQWSDFTNSDPYDDIQVGASSVIKNSGHRPNMLVMGQLVWDKLVNHPDLVERVKYTWGNTANKMTITPEELGGMLGMKVLVGSSVYNNADEGAADSLAFNWGKDALVMYVTPTPGLMSVTAGYHLQLGEARKVETYRDEPHKSTIVRITDKFEQKVVAQGALYLIDAAVA
jgi:hypothetical protein